MMSVRFGGEADLLAWALDAYESDASREYRSQAYYYMRDDFLPYITALLASPAPESTPAESKKMTRSAYVSLIEEDLDWLLAMPRTLERDHIEAIVRGSTERHYGKPEGESTPAPRREASPGSTPEREAWAAQFTCDVHGRMDWGTVRTDKTCGVYVPRKGDACRLLLNRDEAPSHEEKEKP